MRADLFHPWLAAVQRYTRVPVAGVADQDGAALHLPGVGWLVGAAAAVVFALASLLLQDGAYSAFAAAVASTIATVLLTGAMHERAVEKELGTLALLFAVLAKVALLSVLASQSPTGVLVALFAAHCVSRLAALAAIRDLARRELSIAAAWCVPPLLLAAVARGPAFALVAAAVSALAWWGAKRRIDQRRADADASLGIAQQASELAFYFGAAIAH